MSYHTYFDGQFKLNKKLDDTTYWDLIKEHDVRHEGDVHPQISIWDYWIPTEDRKGIKYSEEDDASFYNYVEWLQFLIDTYIEPRGYVLSGIVKWEGEEQGDVGKIIVRKNEVTVKEGRIVYSK